MQHPSTRGPSNVGVQSFPAQPLLEAVRGGVGAGADVCEYVFASEIVDGLLESSSDLILPIPTGEREESAEIVGSVRKLITAALMFGALVASSAPASAGHDHFVYIDATGTCQYVAHGQTAIDDPDHGGHHRFHNNVHTGTPGSDGRGNTFDKEANVDRYECAERGQR